MNGVSTLIRVENTPVPLLPQEIIVKRQSSMRTYDFTRQQINRRGPKTNSKEN